MAFKFESLEVWQDAVDYIDRIYEIANALPRAEEFNLKSQVMRSATSVALNIAEGSTGQTNTEQARFLGIAIRSVVESVACLQLIRRRNYPLENVLIDQAYETARILAARIHTMRRSIDPEQKWLRESNEEYGSLAHQDATE